MGFPRKRSPFCSAHDEFKLTGSIPDPALCALRAAVSWSSRCLDELDEDSEEAELYKLGRQELEESLAKDFNPTGITVDVPVLESSRHVTLSPAEKANC